MNPTITLEDIYKCRLSKSAWEKLLAGLGYSDGKYDPDCLVSLGTIAMANGDTDALWCIRALEWHDIAVRRAVIAGTVLPALKRASVHTSDRRVLDCLELIDRWCSGDDTVNLVAPSVAWKWARQGAGAETRAAIRRLWIARVMSRTTAEAAWADWAKAKAAAWVGNAVWAGVITVLGAQGAQTAGEAARAIEAVWKAAATAEEAAAMTMRRRSNIPMAMRAVERGRQHRDLVKAFPHPSST